MSEDSALPRGRRITVSLDPGDVAELQKRAQRDRLPLSAALLIAARDGFGRPSSPRRNPDSWDDSYDHSLQHELIILTLMATEQAIKLLEKLLPVGHGSAYEVLVPAAQAAQQRIARGIPNSLGGKTDGSR